LKRMALKVVRTARTWCVVACLFSILDLSLQVSTVNSSTYVAAVVEYSPQLYKPTNQTDNLSKNAEQYVEIISQAANQSADIIVFPECGLAELGTSTKYSSVIPDPQDNANPCLSPSAGVHEAVSMLSCAARKYNMYVVVNIPERKDCTEPSSSTCTVFYNCDVVFDRQGNTIARYRKFNLFGEPGFNVTEKPDMTVFNTDFGVKFGVFTCFDIIFEDPAVSLVTQLGVTDIVFPTAWFSELPFLSAVQEQAAWAHSLDVNFLGSGYNAPQGGSTGSGIYAGKHGVLTSIMATSPTTQLLIATVPKKTNKIGTIQPITPSTSSDTSEIYMLKDKLEPYTTVPLTQDTTNKLCNGELCCQFEIKMMNVSNISGYNYRLAVFDGVRSFTFKTGGLQVCAVISCANESLSSCGVPRNDSQTFSTTFTYISITGDFRTKVSLLPNTLLYGYNVMPSDSFSFESQQRAGVNSVNVKMETKSSQTNLMTFGIYGRDFLKDGTPETSASQRTNGENSLLISSVGLVLCIIVTVFLKTLLRI
ncbi:hypothetical protein L9F63_001617, partial [Diploptera punctata]